MIRLVSLLAGLLVLLPAAEAACARVEGRVMAGSAPLPGVVVGAWPSLALAGEPLALSTPSDADGRYQLELPPGRHALAGRDAAGRWFAFSGQNPLAVGSEPVWAGLQAVAVTAVTVAPYDSAWSGALEGVVVFEGKPLAGAYVGLYLDVADDLKGQGYRLSPETGADGRFAFDDLPESDYFLVARKRQGGGRVGPVQAGDWFAFFPGNPVTVRSGTLNRVQLEMVVKQQEALAAETLGRVTATGVRGRVLDAAGRPVRGVHVFAYRDRVIGHQRPAALSAPTGSDGSFVLYVEEAGRYFVGARQAYGDSPAPGELFGLVETAADHGLELVAGELRDDVTIVVEPILAP